MKIAILGRVAGKKKNGDTSVPRHHFPRVKDHPVSEERKKRRANISEASLSCVPTRKKGAPRLLIRTEL